MALDDQFSGYARLLKTRERARRRNGRLIGSAFTLSVVATLALGMLDQLSGRTVYLVSGLIIAFGIGYLHNLMRLEIVLGSLEMLDYVRRDRAGSL
jgi:hypothetical protein